MHTRAHTTTPTRRRRVPLWDNARWIAITLVVVGHGILPLIGEDDAAYSVYLFMAAHWPLARPARARRVALAGAIALFAAVLVVMPIAVRRVFRPLVEPRARWPFRPEPSTATGTLVLPPEALQPPPPPPRGGAEPNG